MSAVIGNMQEALEMAGGSAGFSALFMAGLLSLWNGKYEDREESGYMFWYAIIMLIIAVNPLYIMFIRKFSPSLAFNNIFLWIMPVVPVVVGCGVKAVGLLKNLGKKITFFLGLVGLLILAGATSYSTTTFELKGDSAFDENMENVFSFIGGYMDENGMPSCVIWGENEIIQTARSCDGRIILVYGKDMWLDECLALTGRNYSDDLRSAYMLINEEIPAMATLYEMADSLSCDLVVLSAERYEKVVERVEFERQQAINLLISERKRGRASKGFIYGSDEVIIKEEKYGFTVVYESDSYVVLKVEDILE